MTYPKCGTTWTQEMVWTMLHNPDLDCDLSSKDLYVRSPFLEFDSLTDALISMQGGHNPAMVALLRTFDAKADPDDGMQLQLTRHLPSRRVIKTHLPFSLMPKDMLDTCKVVYVARNPMDQVTSYLHHHRLIRMHDFKGTDAQFVDYFCKGNLMFGDYALHVAEALAHKAHPNLTLLTFEDMKKDYSNKDKAVHKIFVGRITENLTKEDIKDHFETFGTVTDVYIPVPFRHFCFVQFSEFKVAQSLLGKEHSIKGVNVKIGEAAPKGREDGRGGQDRRFGGGGYPGAVGYGGGRGGQMGAFGGGYGGGHGMGFGGGSAWGGGASPGQFHGGPGQGYGANPAAAFGGNGGGYGGGSSGFGGGNAWSNGGAHRDRRY